MVSSPVEAPPEAPQAAPLVEEANQAPPEQTQTEAPATEPVAESAVAPLVEAVASGPEQLAAEPPAAEKPMTRAEAEAFWKEREDQTRTDEREREQNRRRTQAAREAAQTKRDTEARAETLDVSRATLASALGVDPAQITDDAIDKSITRAARKLADSQTAGTMDEVEGVFDFVVASVLEKDAAWDESLRDAHTRLWPKMQGFYNAIYPKIEKLAREGYTANTDLPKIREDAIAAHNEESRRGVENIARVDGTPANSDTSSVADRLDRIGTTRETAADRQWWDAREAAKAARRS